MLRHLTGLGSHGVIRVTSPKPPGVSDRKLRLFACACCRQAWDKLTDIAGPECPMCTGYGERTVWDRYELSRKKTKTVTCWHCSGTGRASRSRRAVEVAERFADGEATQEELDPVLEAAVYADGAVGHWVAPLARHLHRDVAWWQEEVLQRTHRAGLSPAVQAALLRCVVGNPFRPPWAKYEGKLGQTRVPKEVWAVHDLRPWLAWSDGAVVKLAQSIYDRRAWGEMPVLADALEDAGCTDEAILLHCRGLEPCPRGCGRWAHNKPCKLCGDTYQIPLRGPHARGCWVVDLILGKE